MGSSDQVMGRYELAQNRGPLSLVESMACVHLIPEAFDKALLEKGQTCTQIHFMIACVLVHQAD